MILKSILINLLLVATVYCGIVRDERNSNNKCLLRLSFNNNELEPLLIFRDDKSDNHTFSLLVYNEIENNESVWLSCAPFKLQQFPDKQLVKATCKTEQTLEIDGIEIEFSYLKCERAVTQFYEHPVDGCKANDEYKSVKSVKQSIYDPINNISYVTAKICYDDVKENIIFIHRKLSHPNRNLLPLNFQSGQFIRPLYNPNLINIKKRMAKNMKKLNKIEVVSSSDQNAKEDLTFGGVIPTRFITKTNYKLEETLDYYVGQFDEDNTNPHTFNYSWSVFKIDERAVGIILSEKKLNFDVNKICPGGEGEINYNCKYDNMQKTIIGMPDLKINR